MTDEELPEETLNKTRIAGLNFSDKRPVKGEEVIIAGYLQWYNKKGKNWEPVENKNVDVRVDGEKAGESKTDHNGYFVFENTFKVLGEHSVEVKFDGSRNFAPSGAASSLSVITEKQRRNVEKIIKIVLAAIGLIIVIAILALYIAKI
ncbi:MAG: Ig-like domain-containing protein [Archaeoglobaceae archaeon]